MRVEAQARAAVARARPAQIRHEPAARRCGLKAAPAPGSPRSSASRTSAPTSICGRADSRSEPRQERCGGTASAAHGRREHAGRQARANRHVRPPTTLAILGGEQHRHAIGGQDRADAARQRVVRHGVAAPRARRPAHPGRRPRCRGPVAARRARPAEPPPAAAAPILRHRSRRGRRRGRRDSGTRSGPR